MVSPDVEKIMAAAKLRAARAKASETSEASPASSSSAGFSLLTWGLLWGARRCRQNLIANVANFCLLKTVYSLLRHCHHMWHLSCRYSWVQIRSNYKCCCGFLKPLACLFGMHVRLKRNAGQSRGRASHDNPQRKGAEKDEAAEVGIAEHTARQSETKWIQNQCDLVHRWDWKRCWEYTQVCEQWPWPTTWDWGLESHGSPCPGAWWWCAGAPSREETKKKPRSTRPPTSKAAAKPAAKRASRPAVPKSKADKKKDAAKRETAPERKAAAKKEPRKVTTTVSAGNGGEEPMQKEPKEKASVVADGKRKRADEPQDAKESLRSTGSTDSIPSVLNRGCTADQLAEKAVDRAKAAKKAKKERDPVQHARRMRFYRSLTSGALKCCQLQKVHHFISRSWKVQKKSCRGHSSTWPSAGKIQLFHSGDTLCATNVWSLCTCIAHTVCLRCQLTRRSDWTGSCSKGRQFCPVCRMLKLNDMFQNMSRKYFSIDGIQRNALPTSFASKTRMSPWNKTSRMWAK